MRATKGCAPSIRLLLVAYPPWKAATLAGSSAETTTYVFIPLVIVYLIMPWGVLRTYVLGQPALGGGRTGGRIELYSWSAAEP